MKFTLQQIRERKLKACKMLTELNSKKINRTHYITVAKNVGLKPYQVQGAWENFTQSGGKYIDLRVRTSLNSNSPKMKQEVNTKKYSQKGLRNKNISTDEARKIILEYMDSNECLRAIANKHNVTYQKAYNWLKELTVSGTIDGFMIINTKKYAKLPIVDVIYYYKHPDTKRASIKNLTESEKLAYRRCAEVLLKYLPV